MLPAMSGMFAICPQQCCYGTQTHTYTLTLTSCVLNNQYTKHKSVSGPLARNYLNPVLVPRQLFFVYIQGVYMVYIYVCVYIYIYLCINFFTT